MARPRRRRHLLAALLLLCLPSCASVVVPMVGLSEPLRVYGGVRFTAHHLSTRGGGGGGVSVVGALFRWIGLPLLVLDLPLSFVVDTALLPLSGLLALVDGISHEVHESEPRPLDPAAPRCSTFALGLRLGGEPTVLALDTSPFMRAPRTVRDPLPDGPYAPTDGVSTGALELGACVDLLFDGTLFNVVTAGAVWSDDLRVASEATRREAIAWLASVADVTSELSPQARAVVADPRVRRVVVASAPGRRLVEALVAANPSARVDAGVVGPWLGRTVHRELGWDRFEWVIPWRPRGRPLVRVGPEDLHDRPRPPTLHARLGPIGPWTVFVVETWRTRGEDDFGAQVTRKVRRELAACLAALPAGAGADLVWGDDACSLPPGGEVRDALSWVWSSDRRAGEGPGAAARASALAPGVERVVVIALHGSDAALIRVETFLRDLAAAGRSVVLVTMSDEPRLEALAASSGWPVLSLD